MTGVGHQTPHICCGPEPPGALVYHTPYLGVFWESLVSRCGQSVYFICDSQALPFSHPRASFNLTVLLWAMASTGQLSAARNEALHKIHPSSWGRLCWATVTCFSHDVNPRLWVPLDSDGSVHCFVILSLQNTFIGRILNLLNANSSDSLIQ